MKKVIFTTFATAFIFASLVLAPSTSATVTPVVIWVDRATATTEYDSGYAASYATGAPDALACSDDSEQAWTFGEPWAGSKLTVHLESAVVASELQVYFSYDLTDTVKIELADENGDFSVFDEISEDYTCEFDTDAEYPNDIKVSFALDGVSKVSAIRFTVMSDYDYPEIDAVGVLVPNFTKPTKTKDPLIAGKEKVGQYLAAIPFEDTWASLIEPEFTFQWFACTKGGNKTTKKKPSDCSAISGAKASYLKLKAAQSGKFIRLSITATNTVGSTKVFTKATAKVS